MGEKGEGEPAPSAPAEKAEVAAHEREEVKAAPDPAKALPVPQEEPKKAEPKPKPKPEPNPEPKPEPKPFQKPFFFIVHSPFRLSAFGGSLPPLLHH